MDKLLAFLWVSIISILAVAAGAYALGQVGVSGDFGHRYWIALAIGFFWSAWVKGTKSE